MVKPLIRLRKWLWLPIKYKFLRWKYIDDSEQRPVDEVWDRLQKTKELKLISEKGLDQKETYKYEVQINLLNWLLNVSTKG